MDQNQNIQSSTITPTSPDQNTSNTPQVSQANPQPLAPQATNPLFENPDTVEFKGSSKIST